VIATAIVRDQFEGQAARAKMSYVVIAVNTVPMAAPTVGAVLLAVDGWRTIYLLFLGAACVLALAMSLGFAETARIDPANRLTPSTIARNY
jgi:MFS transporter, DHA1 family, multidrug resistance protein